MAVWKEYKIGDLCDTISETYRGHDEEVILINTSDVLEGRILNHQKVPNRNVKGQFKKTFKTQDILYSEIRPENNRFAYVDMKDTSLYIASTKLMVIRANIEIIEPRFLYAILTAKSMTQELQVRAELRSGTFPQITFKTELATIKVCVPDRNTQKKIVSFLDAINRKIEVNNKINRNLQEQVQAFFSRLYCNATDQSKYKSLIKVLGGGTPKTGVESYWNGTIPFFTPKDVGFPYTFETEKNITEDGLTHCNSKLYPANTTFVTARGTVGKVALAGVPMAMNQSCYALISDILPPLMIYFYTLEVVKALKHKANGAVFDAIVTKDFDTEIINVLEQEDQTVFLDFAEPAYKQIYENIVENQRLQTLRNSLLPKLMTGQLDVSEIEI